MGKIGENLELIIVISPKCRDPRFNRLVVETEILLQKILQVLWIPSIAQRNRIAREKLENIQHVPDESPFSLRDPQTEEQRLVR